MVEDIVEDEEEEEEALDLNVNLELVDETEDALCRDGEGEG